ncbi:hypothetical protein NHX12_017378, partial [Muraenolepis orangiensis]
MARPNLAPGLILAALALAGLGVASPLDCDELIKPLVDHASTLGKWIYHAGAYDKEESFAKFENMTSSWLFLSDLSDGRPKTLEYADKLNGQCLYGKSNLTTVGNMTLGEFTYDNQTHVHEGQHLETCPDCLLWEDKSLGSAGTKHLYIFTRTGNLTLPQLEVFKQQAACLKVTAGVHLASHK